jgi:hypothetical protein
VIVRRKNKSKKSESSWSDQLNLLEIDQISLDVIDFQIGLRSVRDIESVDLNESNIIDEKRTRKSTSRYSTDKYAQIIWENEEMRKISTFHAAFMIEILSKSLSDVKIVQSDQSNRLNKSHISNLSSSSQHWRAMLRYSHAEEFRKAIQIEYDAIENRDI